MSKKMCKKGETETPELSKYYCKKCNSYADKESKLCKPKKNKEFKK